METYYHDLLNDRFFDEVIFSKKRNGYFVEVGALDGIIFSQSYHFEKFKNWKGIVVEPVPNQFEKIKKNRSCHISTNPISNKKEIKKFVCRQFSAFSHLEDIPKIYGPSEIDEIIDVETITLYDLLQQYKAPKNIDFISIDTEGYELKILQKFFEENEYYKINLINLECGDSVGVKNLFLNSPYKKIKNPFLDFIKVDRKKCGTVRLWYDNHFYNAKYVLYEGNILDLEDVDWEFYYIHEDFLKKHKHLNKFIISND